MNIILKEYAQAYSKANNNDKYELVRVYNTLGWVEQQKDDGVPTHQIDKFLEWITYSQIKADGPLPSGGYTDLYRLAKRRKLFSRAGR
jgi:hypothetical protein